MTTATIPTMPPSVADILRQVCRSSAISIEELVGPQRLKAFARARFEAVYRIRNEIKIAGCEPSLPQIGRWLNRDHTSVPNALRRYEELGARPASRPARILIDPAPHRHQMMQDLAEASA